MRTASAPLKAWLAANAVSFRADLYTVTLRNGSIYRWTTCDTDILFGGSLYRAAGANGPVVTRGFVRQDSRLSIDVLDVRLVGGAYQPLTNKSLPLAALQGLFDGARLKLDMLLGADLPGAVTLGGITSWFEGRVALVRPEGPAVILRAKSELVALNQTLPRFSLQPACRHAVYDAGCTMLRGTFTLTGSVSSVVDASNFSTASAALTAKAAGYFNLGVLTFTSGGLTGLARSLDRWTNPAFKMALPFPVAPQVGDTFSVYPGCDRKRATCLATFNNLANFRGFPRIPTPESAAR